MIVVWWWLVLVGLVLWWLIEFGRVGSSVVGFDAFALKTVVLMLMMRNDMEETREIYISFLTTQIPRH